MIIKDKISNLLDPCIISSLLDSCKYLYSFRDIAEILSEVGNTEKLNRAGKELGFRECSWCGTIFRPIKGGHFCCSSHSVSYAVKRKTIAKYTDFYKLLEQFIRDYKGKYLVITKLQKRIIENNPNKKNIEFPKILYRFWTGLKRFSRNTVYFDKEKLLSNLNELTVNKQTKLLRRVSNEFL